MLCFGVFHLGIGWELRRGCVAFCDATDDLLKLSHLVMRRVAASTLLASSAHIAPTNFRNVSTSGAVGGKGADCIVEIADLASAVPGDTSSDAWATKAKVALQQLLKRFGPVLEVKLPTSVAKVRFGSARSAEALMKAAPRGFIPLGEAELRLRFPASTEAVWQKFPPARKRSTAPTEDAQSAGTDTSKKRKLRPNERFSKRMPGAEELDESERFWDEQHEKRKEPTAMPPPIPESAAPEPVVEAQEPERPFPDKPGPDATAEDTAVLEGEEAVAATMGTLLAQPFSQQRKAVKTLRRQWHPDKRPDDQAVATRVFQFIQAHDEWLAHHGLG